MIFLFFLLFQFFLFDLFLHIYFFIFIVFSLSVSQWENFWKFVICATIVVLTALVLIGVKQLRDYAPIGICSALAIVGFIASHAGGTFDDNVLRNAMAYGTSLASYTVQRFGTEALQAITPEDVDERVANLWSYGRFDLIESALRA